MTTIWGNLVAKLGRNPINEECAVECKCKRILAKARDERVERAHYVKRFNNRTDKINKEIELAKRKRDFSWLF